MTNEDGCEPLMEPDALTTHHVMTPLSGSIDQQPRRRVAEQKSGFRTLATLKAGWAARVRISTSSTSDSTRTALDVLCSVAADLQINTGPEAFGGTRLAVTHAHTTCSYPTSWEALILNNLRSCLCRRVDSLICQTVSNTERSLTQ